MGNIPTNSLCLMVTERQLTEEWEMGASVQ